MTEYDLPFEKKCSNCNGHGNLITRVLDTQLFRGYKYETKDCHVCKGKGVLPIGPELELELEK